MDHKNFDWGHIEELYNDYGVSVRRVYVDRRHKYVVEKDNGFSCSVAIVSGYGIVKSANVSIEIKPGRVLDIDGGRYKSLEIEATSSGGLSLVETRARANA